MGENIRQEHMEMDIELKAFPYRLQGRVEPMDRFTPYFDVRSVDELLLVLRGGRRAGYFDYEVTLDAGYLAWEEAHRTVVLGTDALEPYDPFGALKIGKYRLNHLYAKISEKIPLTEDEATEVIRVLPPELAERHLRFKLTDIDSEMVRNLMPPQPAVVDDDFEPLEYRSLSMNGSKIEYFGNPIVMPFQQQQVLRTFLERPDTLLWPSSFTANPDIFNPGKRYVDEHATLSKLISEVHRKLKRVVGTPCIFNEPKEGWRLRIE